MRENKTKENNISKNRDNMNRLLHENLCALLGKNAADAKYPARNVTSTVEEEKKKLEAQHTMFFGLYLPGQGFHLCDERKCAEYFPTLYCGRCADYGIVEIEYEDEIAIQFHRTQTFALDEDMYVFGPVFFYSIDDDDNYMTLFEEDIKVMERMVEENLHNYMSYEVSLPVLRIGKTSEILPFFGKP